MRAFICRMLGIEKACRIFLGYVVDDIQRLKEAVAAYGNLEQRTRNSEGRVGDLEGRIYSIETDIGFHAEEFNSMSVSEDIKELRESAAGNLDYLSNQAKDIAQLQQRLIEVQHRQDEERKAFVAWRDVTTQLVDVVTKHLRESQKPKQTRRKVAKG